MQLNSRFQPLYKLLFQSLIPQIEDVSENVSGVVLEVGCGNKIFEPWLIKNVKQYVGLEYPPAVERHSKYSNQYVDVFGDAMEIPFHNDCIDTYISLAVYEHLKAPHKAIEEAYRILKPGGIIVLILPQSNMTHGIPYDFQRWTSYGAVAFLLQHGFRPLKVYRQGSFYIQLLQRIQGRSTIINRLLGNENILGRLIQRSLIALDQNYFATVSDDPVSIMIVGRKILSNDRLPSWEDIAHVITKNNEKPRRVLSRSLLFELVYFGFLISLTLLYPFLTLWRTFVGKDRRTDLKIVYDEKRDLQNGNY